MQPPGTSPAAEAAHAPAALDVFEVAGRMKFFDARRGFGFFVADGGHGDVLVHILHLRDVGYLTAHEGARIHAIVHRTPKGLQVSRILSMDESSAVHPSQLPQRTREKVTAASDWVLAVVKWYNRDRGYGFVCEGEGRPDCLVHADTLRRWGVAPLWPRQAVEIRWGMSSKGRMVAEIRHSGGLPGLPAVH
jgi:CspA family cold shock protein